MVKNFGRELLLKDNLTGLRVWDKNNNLFLPLCLMKALNRAFIASHHIIPCTDWHQAVLANALGCKRTGLCWYGGAYMDESEFGVIQLKPFTFDAAGVSTNTR